MTCENEAREMWALGARESRAAAARPPLATLQVPLPAHNVQLLV